MVSGHGVSPYTLAFQLFQLPYGVVGVSVITAMLPRMSRAVAEGRFDEVRTEFGSSVRLIGAVMVPVSLLLMVLGLAIAVPLYGHGANTVANAVYIGNVLQVYGLALVPFAVFQLLLRVFYSFGDTRTPVFVGAGTTAVNAALMVLLYNLLLGPLRGHGAGPGLRDRLRARRAAGLGAGLPPGRRAGRLAGLHVDDQDVSRRPAHGGAGPGHGVEHAGDLRDARLPRLGDHFGRRRRAGDDPLPVGRPPRAHSRGQLGRWDGRRAGTPLKSAGSNRLGH
ncbi:lipid II flippase MurJ [Nonomuraea ferruginea]